ncbi:uncharacterized protein [Primulina huaijiensis]|uniref:uncharacterized protein isoform X1 n=2 Tax=Primulina huaijiensis TaxID=1492673 RepID=UPI003CC6F3A0
MYSVKISELVLKFVLFFAVRIVVLLRGFCKLHTTPWRQKLFQLNLHLDKEKFCIFNMEPSKTNDLGQFNSSQLGVEYVGPELQVYMVDTSGHANANLKPSDIYFLESKHVHNYSIQTGEEFALEFMRDRVNHRRPFIPNVCEDPSHAPRYLDLKSILGISCTGSESGSDISMISAGEKGSRVLERKNSSLHAEKVNDRYLLSMQSVPPVSEYNGNYKLMNSSSGESGTSSTKLKILCSFAGRILPRPSDGKLRYVGGETRIIRIRKDITWQELWLKTTEIYGETHTIKYQLPGEDLDALVSVSSDEDLLNMMEECTILEDGKGSQKLRMFLLSFEDLDDTHLTLANSDGDSETKYLVAINGMDDRMKKGSKLSGLAGFSGSNLNELEALSIERETDRTGTEFLAVSNINSAGILVPSVATESSKFILPISSKVDLHFFHGQTSEHDEVKQYSPPFGYDLHPPYNIPPQTQNGDPQSFCGTIYQQQPIEGKSVRSSRAQDTKLQEKKGKLEANGSTRTDSASNQVSVNDQFVSSQAQSGSSKSGFLFEETSPVASKLHGELSSKILWSEGSPMESMQVSKTSDVVDPPGLPESYENGCHTSDISPVSESINSVSDPTNLTYFESSCPPQRGFYSERVPREQAELLSRISKSDDSYSSQFLVNQSQNDAAQQDLITQTEEKSQTGNVDIFVKTSISNEKPFPVECETLDHELTWNQKLNQEDPIDIKGPMLENQVLISEAEGGPKLPTVRHEDSIQPSQDPTTDWVNGAVGSHSVASDANGDPQPSTWTVAREKLNVGAPTTEQADIINYINDPFPGDLLSEIFSKAVLSDVSSDIGPLQKDCAVVSVNIENHDPKHWSFFQRLAGDQFGRRDVSLIDQDHVLSSALTKVEEEAPLNYNFLPLARVPPSHVEVQQKYGEDDQKGLPRGDEVVSVAPSSNYDVSKGNNSEGLQYDDLMDNNTKIEDSDYEDGTGNINLPHFDPLLVDFDIHSLQIIKNIDLEELRELGSGTFGTVYHGKWRGSDVAIKRIKKSCFTGRQSEQERLTFDFWKEAGILSKLHHPNVVAFYGVEQDGPGGTLATVTEYMVDGSLRQVLLRKDRHLDRRKRLIIAMDAAFGMEYLHSKNIVHFDLKCDNLLVNLKDLSRPICKVGDFGLSKIKRNTLVSGGVRGTLPWMAPELLNGGSVKVSEKVDAFSFGIVLWEILTGEEPYANMHYGAIIGGIVNNTLRPTIPSYCDPEWRRLMEQCWAPNPAARPSFSEIASRLRVMSSVAQTRKASS